MFRILTLSISNHPWCCSFPCSFHSNCFKDEQCIFWWCLRILKIAFPYSISFYFHIILYSRCHDSLFTNEDMSVRAFSTRQALGGPADPMVPDSLVFIIYHWFKNISLWVHHNTRHCEGDTDTQNKHIRTWFLCSRSYLNAVTSSYL